MPQEGTAVPEQPCGQRHFSIDEAIAHARQSLGEALPKPFWGTKGGQIANVGWVIGYQSADGQKRFRLDYDPGKGVHVNEEDFTRPVGQQKVVHKVELSASGMDQEAERAWQRIREGRMQLYWHRWTSRYDKPEEVIEAEQEVDRQHRSR